MKAETELAGKVMAWLEARGWSVYQEVAPFSYDARADIVAVRGPLLYVVECKLSLGLAVIGQALHWPRYANLVSVATPPSRSAAADTILRSIGLGWFVVGYEDVREEVSPTLRRRVDERLRKSLRPEHQTYAKAGSNGGYFTAWRGTCAALAAYIAEHGRWGFGIEPMRAVKSITHHYATDKSARDCLVRDVRAGKVLGVELRDDQYGSRFVPAGKREADLLV
jgi:hypothetical protein